jgi:Flp pilus assembly protein TadG
MKSRPLARLLRSFGGLRGSQRGNVLVLTALGMPILVGGAGFGVDTAQWYLWKRELQTAVDSAALSGAYSHAQNKAYEASADAELARNVDVVQLTGKSTQLVDWNGGSGNGVQVTARTQRRLPFSSIFLDAAPTIEARATAAVITAGNHCMTALDEEAENAVEIDGHALVSLGCGIASNSRAASAITLSGSARVNASPLSAVGGITADAAHLVGTSTIRPYSTEQNNPFEGVATPASFSPQTYSRPQGKDKKEPTTLLPGTYTGNLSLQDNAVMSPGLYILDGGVMSVNANAVLKGTGVTIVLKNGASIQLNGGSEISLTAPTSTANGVPASLVGVLIFEDQATTPTPAPTSTINGNANMHLGGAIYLPSQKMEISGNASPTTDCLLLVSKKIKVTGSAEIINSCTTPPYSVDTAARVVRLVR